MGEYLIEVDNVDFAYNGGPLVLNDVSLMVREREIVPIFGPSGCGKSTLMNLINGKNRPTKGSVRLNGKEVDGISSQVGLVFQDVQVFENYTTLDVIGRGPVLTKSTIPQTVLHALMGGRLLGGFNFWKRTLDWTGYQRIVDEARTDAFEMLKKVGLKETDAVKYPGELSGGMKRRAAIGMALMNRPRVLLMDEPFTGLDTDTMTNIMMTIIELWREFNFTLLVITHDMPALSIATRAIALSQFWSHTDGRKGEGAKKVFDEAVPGFPPRLDTWIKSPECSDFHSRLHDATLKQSTLRRLDEFNLKHADALA